MRSRFKFVLLATLALLVLMLMSGVASASAATISSDLPDYPPGATVTLTGAGWQAGENVAILVTDDTGCARALPACAGGRGRRLHRCLHAAGLLRVGLHGDGHRARQWRRDDDVHRRDADQQRLHQAQNGSPHTGIADWVGGVLNATQTTYKEGMSSPQRLVIDDGADGRRRPTPTATGYFTFGLAFLHNSTTPTTSRPAARRPYADPLGSGQGRRGLQGPRLGASLDPLEGRRSAPSPAATTARSCCRRRTAAPAAAR